LVVSKSKDEGEEFVLDHKLVWTGWKNNPKFLLDQRQKEIKQEKDQRMNEREAPQTEGQTGESGAGSTPSRPRKGKYLNTAQAAERLGVTNTTVVHMVHAGKLTNMWEPPAGRVFQRQQIALDAGQVREFAKVYRNRRLPGMLREMREGNGGAKAHTGGVTAGTKRGPYKKKHPKVKAADTALAPERKVYLIAEDSPVQGFVTQMKAMKTDIASLKADVEGLSGMVEDAIKGINSLVKLWS
jgi:hypothetical protein